MCHKIDIYFDAPASIDGGGAYSFWPVFIRLFVDCPFFCPLSGCLSAKTSTLARAFEWYVIERSCFT